MIRNVFRALGNSTRLVFKRWPATLVLLALYAALIAAVYSFFSTREATVGQVLVTFFLPLLAVVLFFVLQSFASGFGVEERTGRLISRSLKNFWALLLISIPIILLAWLVIYTSGHVQDSFKPAVQATARTVQAKVRNAAKPLSGNVPWQVTLTTTIEYVLLVLALPLASIHLWLSTSREGLKSAIKSSGRTIAHAFSPRSVIVYVLGFIVFAVIPYFLLFTRTPSSNAWVDVGLFVTRLFLAAVFSLIGWVITVSALGELRATGSTAGDLSQGTQHAQVAT